MVFASEIVLPTGRKIGNHHPTYIIAELGSNHDGSLEKAKRLITLAKEAGADGAKFQSFQVGELINRRALKDGEWVPHPAWDILEKLSLPQDWHEALSNHAKAIGIDFLSAPFDTDRLTLLDRLNVPFIKIASGDLTHHRLLKAAAKTGRPVVLSTGLAYLGEVEDALRVLETSGCSQVAILHCVSLYPPSFAESNIQAMATMARAFGVPVGYSDHTPGSVVPLGAVALGGRVIEKHMTDDKTLPGPDHPYALDVPEFTQMVTDIRNLELALGHGRKEPAGEGERGERIGARRAVYSTQPIAKGTVLNDAMLKVVRHNYDGGIPADHADCVAGRVLTQDVAADTLITWEMI